jgi:cytochrome c oxidase cbb3-type subunit 4
MDINLLREAVTVLSFGSFVGIVVYAVHPGNKERFEQAARLPLDDDSPSPLGEGRDEGRQEYSPSPQPSPKGEGADVGQGFANLRRQ